MKIGWYCDTLKLKMRLYESFLGDFEGGKQQNLGYRT